jgi:hypothetical protein
VGLSKLTMVFRKLPSFGQCQGSCLGRGPLVVVKTEPLTLSHAQINCKSAPFLLASMLWLRCKGDAWLNLLLIEVERMSSPAGLDAEVAE